MTQLVDDIFDQARAKGSIEALSGVKAGKRGPCPMCSAGKKKDTVFSHSLRGLWKCWRGCGGGDVVELVAQMKGFNRIEAARDILGLPWDGSGDAALRPETREARERREREEAERRAKAQAEYEESLHYRFRVIRELDIQARMRGKKATASAGLRRWLGETRALPLDLLGDMLERLTAVRDAPFVHWQDSGRFARAPAMLAWIESPLTGEGGGRIVGRHVTYLTRDGRNKAAVRAPRRIWGAARGGVWLTDRDADLGPLFVAEGIETAASMLAGWRRRHGARHGDGRWNGRALAVLSLDNLQGGIAKDRFDRIDIARPRPDKALKPIVFGARDFPEPKSGGGRVGRVVIGPDHDMRPLRAKVRLASGRTDTVDLSATQRMEISGWLASHAWRVAGGDPVEVVRPALGFDFNDLLMRQKQGRAA